jgi:hypothetical protein
MINLLPSAVKQDFVYARRNTKLLRWSLALFTTFVLFAGLVVAGQLYMTQSIHTYEAQVAASQQQLKEQKLDETQAHLQSISDNLKLVLQVLSREILFSKLLKQVGAAMPNGATLSSLTISKTTGGIDLNAVAKDYQTATQVQLNLQDPANKIFEKADIVNITCVSGQSGTNAEYPCTVTIRALFAKNNPFLFTSTSAGVKN